GFTKPDVLAPGEHVASLRITGTWLDREAPEESGSRQSAPGYARLTGTSASTALVAGVAALVLPAHRSYSPTEVKGPLVAAGRRRGKGAVGGIAMGGNGRLDFSVGTVACAGVIALLAGSRALEPAKVDPLMLAVLVVLAVVAQRVPVFLFRSSAISVSVAAVI